MRKSLLALVAALFAIILCFGGRVSTKADALNKLPDFTDDFENYDVDGKYIESNAILTKKWDNNVFRGGEPLGMDSHIYEKAKIEYENGNSGNKVLHINNVTGADSFFYMGPADDYRVKNFSVSFKVKFLTEEIDNKEGDQKRSWVGISFRKKSNFHYTGTNNLMFNIQRCVDSTQITGHAYGIFDGGLSDLSETGGLYGDRLSLNRSTYSIPSAESGKDSPWVTYKLDVQENKYVLSVDGFTVAECEFNIENFYYFGYLSLNCCTANILVDDFKVEVKDETLPPVIAPLDAPVVVLDENEKKITWDFVSGASNYVVTVDGKEKTVFKNSYSLEKLGVGEHKITVRALSDDVFEAKDSLESNEIIYVVKATSESKPADSSKKGCPAAVDFGGIFAILALCSFGVIIKKKI